MQTFLPYPDFEKSLKCLDWKRLGKQRVEAKQILDAIRTGKGWIHHPITKMWTGYEDALGHYMNLCIDEWIKRGYNNNMEYYPVDKTNIVYPHWLGDKHFHQSHRENLLRKDEKYYRKYFPGNKPSNRYVWIVDGVKYIKPTGTKHKIILNS